MNQPEEKRKYQRYDTEVKLYFHLLPYDIQTKIEYQLLDKNNKKISPKHAAVSKNVSVEGLSFISGQELKLGDYLDIEIFLPDAPDPVRMEGEVRWSRSLGEGKGFQTGVLLKKVNKKPIPETIYFDPEYKVNWSIVLESVLGKFKDIAKDWKKQ